VPGFITNFADAWVQWWHAAEPISKYLLWGHPIFFWARIGKLMELVGALFIVIDWIGRERIASVTVKVVAVVEGDQLPAVPKRLINLLDRVTGGYWQDLQRAVRLLEWLFQSDNRIRILNLLFLFLGFVLDFLGS